MIELTAMTEEEFQAFLQFTVPDYAQENVQAGRWSEEEALQGAKEELEGLLLSQGLQTPGHFLYMIRDDQLQTNIGTLWFSLQKQGGAPQVFVYFITIFEEFRRRGYATQAFRLLETKAEELHAPSIGLHVFGHNLAARNMYEKLGYATTNVYMMKKYSKN